MILFNRKFREKCNIIYLSPSIYYLLTEFESLINKALDKLILFQNSHFFKKLDYQFLLLIYKRLMKCTIYYALIFKHINYM